MPTAEETYVDLIVAVDPSLTPCHDGVFHDYTATHGQLLDELLTKVASLSANFAEYRKAFPPPPPFDD